jgi:ABC-type glycerol-3-phosphate transport system permease component
MQGTRLSRATKDLLCVALALAVVFVFLFPVFWMIISSLKPLDLLFSHKINLFGFQPVFEYYAQVVQVGFLRFVVNSVIVSILATAACMAMAFPAAYAFSRFRFRGRIAVFSLFGLTQIFPWIILVTPIFIIFFSLGLSNTYLGLVVIYIAVSIPFTTYMLFGYLETIPKEIDDAAVIDGCSALRTIVHVVMPIAVPGLVAAATHAFIVAWNEFLFALTLITTTEKKTAPVALATFFGEYGTNWGQVLAAATVTSIPTLLFFLCLQRYLLKGLTAGSVKQ